jgi:hypothetical protein
VRTVLFGLRQLPLLTPRYYRRAGGLRGLETLVISRALLRAGAAVGPGTHNIQTARSVAGALIMPAGSSQAPKGRRVTVSALTQQILARSDDVKLILHSLQRDDLARPAVTPGSAEAWQLDHDYLARAVLAEARQADRWSVAVREGEARYEHAIGWRQRWAALLPAATLLRVAWERVRGRLRFGEAARYVGSSAIKSALAVGSVAVLAAAAYTWNRDRLP